jgi:non-ribosomal peptide synthetase component F
MDGVDVKGEERLFKSELGLRKVENETWSVSRRLANLPAGQQTIRAKCFHPTGTFVEFPPEEIEQSIPERFEKIVRMHPDRQAVKAQDKILSYSALDERANQIANAILSRCGQGEEPIALLMDNHAGTIATILGILKSGKIYISLDPSYPKARLTAMLRDSQPRVIVTDHKNYTYATELAENGHQLIDIDDLGQSVPSTNPRPSATPDTVACIFYTSGSTGEPKGVVHNHRNLLHKTMAYTNDLHICAEDRLSLLYSCSFAASLRHIFGKGRQRTYLSYRRPWSCPSRWLLGASRAQRLSSEDPGLPD